MKSQKEEIHWTEIVKLIGTHWEIVSRFFTRDDYIYAIVKDLHLSRKRVGEILEELKEAGIIEEAGRKKVKGRDVKPYRFTHIGLKISDLLLEAKDIVEQKPSRLAEKKEITQCLELLMDKNRLRRKLGAGMLWRLSTRKCIAHDRRVMDFLMKASDDPSYADIHEILLNCLRTVAMQVTMGRGLPHVELDLNNMRERCLRGKNRLEVQTFLQAILWKDGRVGVNVIIDMVKEFKENDARYDIPFMLLIVPQQLSYTGREYLMEKLLGLALDPRDYVIKRAADLIGALGTVRLHEIPLPILKEKRQSNRPTNGRQKI